MDVYLIKSNTLALRLMILAVVNRQVECFCMSIALCHLAGRAPVAQATSRVPVCVHDVCKVKCVFCASAHGALCACTVYTGG